MKDKKLETFLLSQGYYNLKVLETGELAGVMKMLFTTGLIVGLDWSGYRTRFCFENEQDAIESLNSWDGKGTPPGWWIKQK